MTPDQVRRNVVHSTLAGYLRIVVRMGLGLVTFRLLYQGLGPEEFGFWSLLWAVFGFGILLDFGFGQSVQKWVALLSHRRDWTELSRVLSTIVFAYLACAAAAALLGMAFAGPIVDLFGVGPAHRSEFIRVLRVFLAGIGIAFPLGLFPEILQGQQRITTASNLALASILANAVCVVAAVSLHLPFLALVVLAQLCVIVPCLVAASLALRHMPEVRIRPGLFSLPALRETTRFGAFAYLNLLGNAVRNKADPPVISALLGIAAVATYQPGGKVGEMFGLLTRQIADVLSPTAAHLHARGDGPALRRMLVDGVRFSVLAATPLYLLTAASMDGLLRLLTGMKAPTATMLWTAELLLFWNYSLVLTHWVFKRMYLMAGQERRMTLQGVAEAAANLLLSVGLTAWLRSTVGVAWGSVIPTLLFGWLLLWPWAAREAGMRPGALFRHAVLPTWIGCLPMIAVLLALKFQPWWTRTGHPAQLLAEAGIAAAVGGAGLWRFGLRPEERTRLAARWRSLAPRGSPGA